MAGSAGNLDDNNCDYVTIDFSFAQFALMSDSPTPHGLYPPEPYGRKRVAQRDDFLPTV